VSGFGEQKIRGRTSNEIVYSTKIRNTDLKLFSGDIVRSTAQVVVSSDDTLLSASGGVAKSIVGSAGRLIKQNLRELSAKKIPRGALAITGGGLTKFTYILHAVVLTKASDYTEYPSMDEIRALIQRIIHVADATAIESIALPIHTYLLNSGPIVT
jgi:O-acetyl-ADP-ribose deacetylase (regulator of RNase III)